jgi:hypothetical protein
MELSFLHINLQYSEAATHTFIQCVEGYLCRKQIINICNFCFTNYWSVCVCVDVYSYKALFLCIYILHRHTDYQ